MQLINTKEPDMVAGFIDGLNDVGLSAQLCRVIETRRIIRSLSPFGYAIGDGAFVIPEEASRSFVVRDLEALNPGNERNVLKWAVPHASAETLSVQPG
jgi:hypothetical protein